MIKKIKKIVKSACDEKIVYAWGYHMVPMVKYALILAGKLKADKEIVEISAWLHDISWLKGDLSNNHNKTSAEQAEIILESLKYPKYKIKAVKHCILGHRGTIPRKTKEAECIASADTMSHFDQIPALFYLAYHDGNMSIEDAKRWLWEKIERGWRKLDPEAKRIMKEKYRAIKLLIS